MAMTSQAVKNIAVTALCVVLTAIAVIVAVPVVRIVYRIDSFVTTDRLKNLENNIDTSAATAQMTANAYGEIAKSTTDAIDRHVSPAIDSIAIRFDSAMLKVEHRVEALAPLQSELTATVKQGNAFLANTDWRVNGDGGLLAEATSLINNFNLLATKFGLTVDQLNEVVKTTADKLGMSVDAFTRLLADPNLPKIIANLEKGTTDFAGMAANGKKATDELPQLFIDIRKMGDHANKFQKFVTVARILGLIAPFLVAF